MAARGVTTSLIYMGQGYAPTSFVEKHIGLARSQIHKLVDRKDLRGERAGRVLFVAISSLRLYYARSEIMLRKIDELAKAVEKYVLDHATERATDKHAPAIREARRRVD